MSLKFLSPPMPPNVAHEITLAPVPHLRKGAVVSPIDEGPAHCRIDEPVGAVAQLGSRPQTRDHAVGNLDTLPRIVVDGRQLAVWVEPAEDRLGGSEDPFDPPRLRSEGRDGRAHGMELDSVHDPELVTSLIVGRSPPPPPELAVEPPPPPPPPPPPTVTVRVMTSGGGGGTGV